MMKLDKEILMETFHSSKLPTLNKKVYDRIPNELFRDKELVLRMLQSQMCHSYVAAELYEDFDVAKASLSVTAENVISYWPAKFKNNKELAKIAVKTDHRAFQSLSEELQHDISFILDQYEHDGLSCEVLPKDLKYNQEVADGLRDRGYRGNFFSPLSHLISMKSHNRQKSARN